MNQLCAALIEMRRSCPTLQGIGPGNVNLQWLLASDGDASIESKPKSVLEIRVAASDTNAAVPFEVLETVTIPEPPGAMVNILPGNRSALDVAELIADALNRRFFVSESSGCVIHGMQKMGMTAQPGDGRAHFVTITWKGRASWRPRT